MDILSRRRCRAPVRATEPQTAVTRSPGKASAATGEWFRGHVGYTFPQAALDAPYPGYKTLTAPARSMTT
ncbi:MAG: hypothetical protein E7J78_25130, partial [Pantoea sp.]|nr:hypothetical protein [Pantoea sp.]